MILHWGYPSTFALTHALLSFMNGGGLFPTLVPANHSGPVYTFDIPYTVVKDIPLKEYRVAY